jgi:signal recognition particle subunit SRP72
MSAKTLSALLQSATIDDHEEVLQACNTSLKQSKKDPGVQHVKVVALLKLDRYDDALRVLEDGGDELKNKAGVERAYALYKIGKLVEAKEIVTGIVNDRGARHVEAQAVRIPSISKGHLGASS